MKIVPRKKRMEIFANDRKMRSFFRPEHGYKVFVRCKYCGAWTLEPYFCNRNCSNQFRKFTKQYPSYVNNRVGQLEEFDASIEDCMEQRMTLSQIERKVIVIALKQHDYNMLRTAITLNITRRTLYNKIQEWGFQSKAEFRRAHE